MAVNGKITTPRPGVPARAGGMGRQPVRPGSAGWLGSLNNNQQGDFRKWIAAANKPKPVVPGRGPDANAFDDWIRAANGWIAPQGPSQEEEAQWQVRTDYANSGLQDALARYEFQGGELEDQFTDRQQDVERGFGRARERTPYNHLGRGTLTSGLYRDDLQEVAGEKIRALRDLLGARASGLQGLELDRSRAEDQRARALAQIEQERALRRMALGSRLGGV